MSTLSHPNGAVKPVCRAAVGQAQLIVERGLTSFALGSPQALELFAVRDQARAHARRLGYSLDDQVEAGEQALTLCVAHEIGAMQSAGREEIAPAAEGAGRWFRAEAAGGELPP
jgi:hypothetical protein